MTRCKFKGNHQPSAVSLPDGIRPTILAPPDVPATVTAMQCVRAALDHPIESVGLTARVRQTDRVAVIVDDITRETPVAAILPLILARLADAGLARDRITIVIALGSHRPMTAAEIDEKIGAGIARRHRIINDPATCQAKMVYLGRSERGVPAWVHQAVVQADVRIGVGMIMPHLDAGFGGGAKIVLPGVCGQPTVDAFHGQMADVTVNPLGVADTPLRLDLERFVAAFVPLHFIVNVILNQDGDVVRCVAGDAIAAHRAGVRHAREIYGVPVARRFPVVVAFAHPHQIDLWQCTKALAAGEMITRRGGHLILVADCPEGTGPHPAFTEYIGMAPEVLRKAIDDGTAHDRCAAADAMALCRMRQRLRIAMVSPGLAPETIGHMGFTAYASLEQAVDRATRETGATDVALLSHGGVSLPLLADAPCTCLDNRNKNKRGHG